MELWFSAVYGARVRPIPCWRPIPETIVSSCTDTDTGNDVT